MKMKSHIMPYITVAAAIACVGLLLIAIIAYPMHIGEPAHYHVCRVDCLVAATACGLASVVASVVAEVAHF